jgi:serine/threonine-protein kinase
LNQGPETGTIPNNLVGQDIKDVKSTLKDLKFSNVNQKAAKSENSKTQPGEVIKISPQEGETVPLDTKITVTYATGKSTYPTSMASAGQQRSVRPMRPASATQCSSRRKPRRVRPGP